MAEDSPVAAPAPVQNVQLDNVRSVVAAAQKPPHPMQTQVITDLNKNSRDQGIKFTPGQPVDIPHSLGRAPAGVNVVRTINDTNAAKSAPAAAPNLQVISVRNATGQKVMRVRYIAPKDDLGKDIMTPVRMHLEVR